MDAPEWSMYLLSGAEGMRLSHRGHANGKAVIEAGLPGIVMHDRRDAGQDVLRGPTQQCRLTRNRSPAGDGVGVTPMNVVPPLVRIRIGPHAEPPIVVPMQMIVRVDEPGHEIAVLDPEHGIRVAIRTDDDPVLDADGRIASLDANFHRRYARMSTSLSPRCASYASTRSAAA